MTRQEEVLKALADAHGEWVDGSTLATAEVGGSEGLKRLRELRAAGWPIEERRHPDARRAVWQYRLPAITIEREPVWRCVNCGTVHDRQPHPAAFAIDRRYATMFCYGCSTNGLATSR